MAQGPKKTIGQFLPNNALVITRTGSSTGNVVNITAVDTSGTGTALNVNSSSTGTVGTSADVMRITNSATGNIGTALRIDSPSTASGNDAICLDIRRAGTSQVSNNAIRLNWGFGTASLGNSASNVIHLNMVNTNFSIPVIRIDCATQTGAAGTGLIHINVTGAGNQQMGINIVNSAANTATMFRIDQSSTASGDINTFSVLVNDSSSSDCFEINKSGNGPTFDINKTGTAGGNIIDIDNSGTGISLRIAKAGGAGNVIDIDNTGSGYDIIGNNDHWYIDRRGHALLSGTPSRLKHQLNGLVIDLSSVFLSGTFNNTSKWQQIAMSSAQGAAAVDGGYEGVTFDGRYLYFVANNSDTFVRYDTTKSFTDITSWEQMQMDSAQGAAVLDSAYVRNMFDGRYIYYCPYNSDTFIRYDTFNPFTVITSWQQVAMQTAFSGDASVDGAFRGATFDGRFVHFAASNSDTFVRYDTTGSFTAAASWSRVAMSTVFDIAASAVDNAFDGATFDGRYIYYAAYDSDTFVRYDTTVSYAANGSWGRIQMNSAQGGATLNAAYNGCVCDGQFVYFCPRDSDTLLRFNRIFSFTDNASGWVRMLVNSAQGVSGTGTSDFVGVTFDGHYVYYAPLNSDTFIRHDATNSGTFNTVAPWEQMRLSSGQGAAAADGAYRGMAFDGTYIYFSPYDSDTFIRLRVDNTPNPFTSPPEYAQVST